MPKEPQNALSKYPQGFVEAVQTDVQSLLDQGRSPEEAQAYADSAFKAFNEKHALSDRDFAEQPEWFAESALELKEKTKKRGFINRVGRTLASLEVIPGSILPTGIINPLVGEESEDLDVISPEMVRTTDDLTKTIMFPDGGRDGSKNLPKHIEATREILNSQYNPSFHRTQKENIDMMMEESYSEMMSFELEESLASLEREEGATKRDILLLDPDALKAEKKRWIDMGYTGNMVERAFEKVLYENKRELFVEHFDESFIKKYGKETVNKNKELIFGKVAESAHERAENLFNKDELERMELNMQLEELRSRQKSAETDKEMNRVGEQIRLLNQKLGYERSPEEQLGKPYKSNFFAGIGQAFGAPVKKTDRWKKEEGISRMYDSRGRKIMRSDATKEEVEHERDVTAQIKQNAEINELPDRLRQEMVKSEKVLLDLESARDALRSSTFDNKDWMSKASDDERAKQQRRMANIREEINQETIRFEAVSRMYLLNQNVAVQDKNAKNYALDMAVTARDINFKPFIDNPNPSIEQVRDVVRPIYEELGIDLDSKEYQMTEPDIIKEITRGTTHLTDMAIKMAIIDKLGGAGVTAFFDGMANAGKVGKVASEFMKLMWEEKKFQMIGGHKGTGAAFYAANKAFPTVKTGNKNLDLIWNGFMKGTVGMTVAMEGAAEIEAAYDALANDKDMIRNIKEQFGDVSEASRRILVELITAAPFGIKGLAERGALHKANAETVWNVARELESKGRYEDAVQLKSDAVKLGDRKLYDQYADYMWKADVIRGAGKYDRKMNLAEIDAAYEKHIKETGEPDMLKNKKVLANVDDKYFNPKVQFDALEFAGKIETLQKQGVDVSKKRISEIDKEYADVIDQSNAYMTEMRDAIPPEVVLGDVPAPKRSVKYKSRESEVAIKEEYNKVSRTPKDVKWEKAIAPSAKRVQKTVADVKKRLGKEAFDEMVEMQSGIEGGAKEFDFMVQNLGKLKTKKAAKEQISLIEDVVHKAELQIKPEGDVLSYVTRRSNEGENTTTDIKDFRNNLASYKRGIKDGRVDLNEGMQKLYDMASLRSTRKLAKQLNTAAELKNLAKPLPANANPGQILKRLEAMDVLFKKLEKRQFENEIKDSFKRYRSRNVAGRSQQLSLDFVGGSKIAVAEIMFNTNTKKANTVIAMLRSQLRNAKKGTYAHELFTAQINALRNSGSRELALERQAQLESINNFRELTLSEKIEYEMLNLADGKRMTHADALRARETVREIERTGRTVRERQEQADAIKEQLDIDATLKAFNVSEEALRKLETQEMSPESRKLVDRITKLKEKTTDFMSAHESFISMMEMLSAHEKGREAWTGHLQSVAEDLYRAREGENSQYNRELNIRRAQIEDIYGKTGREMDKILKRNKSKAHRFDYFIAGNMAPREISVDQAAMWWQWLHNPQTWPAFGKYGWGIKPDNKARKFEAKEAKEMMQSLESFMVKAHGNDAPVRAAENMFESYDRLFPEINEVFLRKNGTDMGYRVNYSPILFERYVKLDAEGKEIGTEQYSDLLSGSAEYFVRTASPAFTKIAMGSGNVKLDFKRGSEEVFSDYLRRGMHYKHFQEPIDRMKSIFSNPQIKRAMKAKYGTEMISKMIDKHIADIATDVGAGDKLPWLTNIKNKFVTANLGANLLLFPKQMTSITAFGVGLKTPAESAMFQRLLWESLATKEGWDAYRELAGSEFMVNRAKGQSYNRDLTNAQRFTQDLYKAGRLKPDSIRDWLLIMTKLGDRLAILGGGVPFYRTKLASYKKEGLSPEAAKQKAYEDFVKFAKLTQQSGFTEDLGHIQRFGTIGKYATLFQNTPQQYFRVEVAAWRNAKAKQKLAEEGQIPKAEARKAVMRSARDIAIYHFMLPMFFRAASQGFYLGKDDKGANRFIDDPGQLIAALTGSYSYMFILGDLGKNMLSRAFTGHGFDTQVGGVLQDVVSGAEESLEAIMEMREYDSFQKEFGRVMDGTSPVTWQELLSVAGTFSEFTGFPGTSLMNISKGVGDYMTGRTDNPAALIGLSASAQGKYTRSPQYDAMRPYLELGFEEGAPAFIKHMMQTTDIEYFKRNQARWIREFNMYSHFGGYNQDVNFLYTEANSNSQRATFLRAIRDGKDLLKPMTIADFKRITQPAMSPAQFEEYLRELVYYGVIEKDVIKEMIKQDRGVDKKVTEAMRKAAQ
jgi:carbon monoxide dehydrogenase subunit G